MKSATACCDRLMGGSRLLAEVTVAAEPTTGEACIELAAPVCARLEEVFGPDDPRPYQALRSGCSSLLAMIHAAGTMPSVRNRRFRIVVTAVSIPTEEPSPFALSVAAMNALADVLGQWEQALTEPER
jgi:hypothetical protein